MFNNDFYKKMEGLAKRAFKDVTGRDFECDPQKHFFSEFDKAVWALSSQKQDELDNQIDSYLRGDYKINKNIDRKLN